jgi:hypothetical protein
MSETLDVRILNFHCHFHPPIPPSLYYHFGLRSRFFTTAYRFPVIPYYMFAPGFVSFISLLPLASIFLISPGQSRTWLPPRPSHISSQNVTTTVCKPYFTIRIYRYTVFFKSGGIASLKTSRTLTSPASSLRSSHTNVSRRQLRCIGNSASRFHLSSLHHGLHYRKHSTKRVTGGYSVVE